MDERPEMVSDQELARHSRAGSLQAFEQLVFRYEARIYAFLLALSRNPDDAQELAQETFVKAYHAIDRYKQERSFAAWLFAIARHAAIDRQRRAYRMTAEPLPDEADYEDPAELLTRKDERTSLWQFARQTLPELQFQALWLRYAQDMDVEAIATALRKTKTHVKVLLFRARQTLIRELERTANLPGTEREQVLPVAVAAQARRL